MEVEVVVGVILYYKMGEMLVRVVDVVTFLKCLKVDNQMCNCDDILNGFSVCGDRLKE